VKPLLSYYGGKQRIASRILAEIEQIPHTVYVEPFAGGATLLFAKPVRIVSNDDHCWQVAAAQTKIRRLEAREQLLLFGG